MSLKFAHGDGVFLYVGASLEQSMVKQHGYLDGGINSHYVISGEHFFIELIIF